MSITGTSSIRRLNRVAFVMGLDELGPFGGRAAGGRDGRRLERFAEVCKGMTSRGRSHPGLRPLANLRFEVRRLLPAVFSEPDVAAAPRALQWKLLAHPRHQFRPRNPRRVVRAGLLIRVTAASRGVVVARMPARLGNALLADIPFCHVPSPPV
jgi:hypothetical protein